MATFFKSTNRQDPKSELPSVVWNPRTGSALFEFARGESGFLECHTDDPEAIDKLREMGYVEDETQASDQAPKPAKAPGAKAPK